MIINTNSRINILKNIELTQEQENNINNISALKDLIDTNTNSIKDLNTIHPTYIKPELIITKNIINDKIELGSNISVEFKMEYIQNDAGKLINCLILKEDEILDINKSEYKSPIFTLNNDITYSCIVSYDEGIIKNNNFNEADKTGYINSGTIKKNITIKACRAFFAFTLNEYTDITPELIRNQNIKGLDLNNNDSISVEITNDTKIICFAYPSTLNECSKIIYENINNDCKNLFTKIVLQIPDANNNNKINYNVYYYEVPIEFGNKAIFTLKM